MADKQFALVYFKFQDTDGRKSYNSEELLIYDFENNKYQGLLLWHNNKRLKGKRWKSLGPHRQTLENLKKNKGFEILDTWSDNVAN